MKNILEDFKLTKHYRDTSVPENWDRQGLPGWCYKSHSLLNLEIENVFLNHWQIICHVSDVKDIGEIEFNENSIIINKSGDMFEK